MVLLVGGYTVDMDPETPGRARGISAYDFFTNDGRLEYRGYVPAINPSYLCVDNQRKIVYSVRECPNEDGPGVTAHRVSRGKKQAVLFHEVSNVDLNGDHPCHLLLAERTLIVSCYTSGTVHVFQLAEDGTIGKEIQTLQLNEGQDANAHCSAFQRERGWVLICDLGGDSIRIFDRMDSGELVHLTDYDLPTAENAGPRHVVITPDGKHALVNGEHRGVMQIVNLEDEKPRLVGHNLYLPERLCERASGAGLRIAPGGKNIYVSDRNFDLITALRFDNRREELSFRDSYATSGNRPRDFNLSPDGNWLIAANLSSHNLATFRINPKGELKLYHVTTKVPSPTCLTWMSI